MYPNARSLCLAVPEASQKREPLSQGSRRNVQTQTEGPECGHRRRERVSVAFDDTQYEPYGLPEVVMKGMWGIGEGKRKRKHHKAISGAMR